MKSATALLCDVVRTHYIKEHGVDRVLMKVGEPNRIYQSGIPNSTKKNEFLEVVRSSTKFKKNVKLQWLLLKVDFISIDYYILFSTSE